MTREQRRADYKARIARKPATVSALCFGGGHKVCKGMSGRRHDKVCQCYCHVHVCPRCKQPTAAATRGALLNSAAQLEEMAKSIRIKALAVNA